MTIAHDTVDNAQSVKLLMFWAKYDLAPNVPQLPLLAAIHEDEEDYDDDEYIDEEYNEEDEDTDEYDEEDDDCDDE